MTQYDYIDPRGKRSGPFTEDELKSLAARGLLEPEGTVVLSSLGTVGRVAEIPWLLAPQADRARPDGSPPPPPPGAAPPRTSEEAIAIAREMEARRAAESPQADLSRATYVLMAILPSFIGIFGAHNLAAGFIGRGVAAVLLSVLTFGGLACLMAPPCACLAVPVWIVLFAVSVWEAFTVRCDARGRPFR